jgi:serine/threonine-protein kinase
MLAGVGLTAFLLGYAFSALVLFPAPIFASSRSVPRLIALEEAAAIAALEQQNLRPGDIERAPHPDAPAGRVVWQDPPPGVGVPEGTIVRLVVSGGPQRIPVPDLVGYDAAIARELVDAAGLSLGRVDETQAPVPRGVVVASRPATGATLPPGGRVTLVVSAGAPTITVPQIVGLTPEEATTVLEEAGLTLGTSIRRTALGAQPGTIMEQTPAPGTLAAPGTAVNVIVARRRSP